MNTRHCALSNRGNLFDILALPVFLIEIRNTTMPLAYNTSRQSLVSLITLFVLVLLLSLLPTDNTWAAPDKAKGNTPWAMVLCKYPHEGVRADWQPVNWKTFFGPGTGGLTDYFHDISNGTVDLSGSRVFGWFDLP